MMDKREQGNTSQYEGKINGDSNKPNQLFLRDQREKQQSKERDAMKKCSNDGAM